MKWILVGIVLVVIIFSLVTIPSIDAASHGKLTIKGESSTIYSNESVYFRGKLTDNEGYAISFERINLWENRLINSAYEWKQIASGKTDARGNYKITVDANFWDYGKSVTIIANSANSIQSSTVTINIQKPYSYQIENEIENYVQPAKSNKIVSTQLILNTKSSNDQRVWEIFPKLKSTQGTNISDQVDIYLDGDWAYSALSNEWFSISLSRDKTISLTAKYDGGIIGSKTYSASSDTVKIKPLDKKQTTKKSTITNNDNQYKDSVYSLKPTYYDLVSEIKNQIILSENTLSGLNFESSEAKKKIERAWNFRDSTWTNHGRADQKLKDVEYLLENRLYESSYDKLSEIDRPLRDGKNHLVSIVNTIKEARDLEKQYQEDNPSCFLFWCNVKDQNKGLDLKIKDLELKVEKIKYNQQDITIQYQNIVQDKQLLEQRNEFMQIQDILEFEKVETELVTKETQQRLEEQREYEAELRQLEQREYEAELLQQEQIRLQEQREYEAELRQQEQIRLQEQREYEAELRQQEIYAEQERQRLELQKQIADEKNRIKTRSQNYPLIKGWMNGELTFYVPTMDPYVSQSVKSNVENLASWMDGKYFNGIKLKRVYSGYADITVQWARDWQGHTIGVWLGSDVVVGLGGTSICDNKWKPFDATTVYRLMYHEMGHALGQNHNSDPDNVMYKKIKNFKYEYEYDESIILIDKKIEAFLICSDGTYSFVTEKTGTKNGYKAYVIPPRTSAWDVIYGKAGFYLDCSSYKDEMRSTSSQCYVPAGSALVLYNPSVFGKGSDIPIDVKITNISSSGSVDYSFDSDDRQFSDEYRDRIRELFR